MSLLDKLEKRYTKIVLLPLALVFAINTASISVTAYQNSKINSDRKTVVFTSGGYNLNSSLLSEVRDVMYGFYLNFLMYTPITMRQNLKGNKVEWQSNATRKQVLDALQNSNYQNIIFIGHGNKSTYVATDGYVSVDDLVTLNLPARQGEFIQHTCGEDIGKKSLKEIIYPNGSRGYDFDREIRTIESYAKALTELVKTQNEF